MRKMNFRKFLLMLALPLMAVGFVACNDDDDDGDVNIEVKHGTNEGATIDVPFLATADDEDISVIATHEWAIKNEASIPSWITVTPKTGKKGTNTVKISVTENDGTHSDFTIEFYLKNYTAMVAKVTVKQAAAGAQETTIKALNDRITTTESEIGNYFMKAIVVTDMAKGNYTKGSLSIMTKDANTAGNGILLYGEYGQNIEFIDGNGDPLYAAGDEIEIDLSTLKMKAQRGNGAQDGDPYCNEIIIPGGTVLTDIITKTGSTATLTAIPITYDQIEDFQNMYVAIAGAQSKLDNITNWAANATAFTYRDDLTTEFSVYLAAGSEIVGETFLTGNGTLKGIAYVYPGSNSARSVAQIVPRVKADVEGLTDPRVVGETKTFTVSPDEDQTVGASAGTLNFTVTANVAWTVTSSDDVNFAVSPASGTTGGTVTLTYTGNTSATDTRSAVITFTTTDTEIPEAEREVVVNITQNEKAVGGTNLLLNPSFETIEGGVPASWTNAGAAWEVVNTGAQDGTYALKIAGDASNRCDVKQTVNNIIPGETYIVSFWYKDNNKAGTTSGVRLWSSFTGTSEKPAGLQPTTTLEPVTEWTEYRVEVVAPAGATGFNFEIRATKISQEVTFAGLIDNCTFMVKE